MWLEMGMDYLVWSKHNIQGYFLFEKEFINLINANKSEVFFLRNPIFAIKIACMIAQVQFAALLQIFKLLQVSLKLHNGCRKNTLIFHLLILNYLNRLN